MQNMYDIDTDTDPLVTSPSPCLLKTSTLQQQPSSHPLLTKHVPSFAASSQDLLLSPHGPLSVYKMGNSNGPAMITFPDLGLTGVSNYQV